MNELIPMLQEGLLTIFGAVLTLLAALATRAVTNYTVKVKAEAASIKDNALGELAMDAITLAEQLALTTVTAIEQTTAATLRQAVKDGTATPEEMKELAYDAVLQLKVQLHPTYLHAIEDVYGDAENYLLNLIEQKVWELKNLPAAQGA